MKYIAHHSNWPKMLRNPCRILQNDSQNRSQEASWSSLGWAVQEASWKGLGGVQEASWKGPGVFWDDFRALSSIPLTAVLLFFTKSDIVFKHFWDRLLERFGANLAPNPPENPPNMEPSWCQNRCKLRYWLERGFLKDVGKLFIDLWANCLQSIKKHRTI